MNKTIAMDAATLKLHVADGYVWQTAGKELGRCTNLTPEDYVKSASRWDSYDGVRLMGTYANASLICGLFGRTKVELVTPLVCPASTLRKDPQAALFYMRSCLLAPSQGGYHTMTQPELHIYRGCAAARASKRVEDALPHVQQHPVWRIANFMSGLAPNFLAGVLITVLDPRWYVDTSYPDRSAKLLGYFGLNPKTQAGALGLGPAQRHDARCKLAMHTWHDKEVAKEILFRYLQLGNLSALYDATERGLQPGDVLWRVWASNYNKRRDTPEIAASRATVRASQVLLEFVRLVWLDAIYRNSASLPDGRAPLFRPRDFFRSIVESNCFERYAAAR